VNTGHLDIITPADQSKRTARPVWKLQWGFKGHIQV